MACFLCGTSCKAEHDTNRRMLGVIICKMIEIVLRVASGAIPSGVPVALLPCYFSIFCKWHIWSAVTESACFVSFFTSQHSTQGIWRLFLCCPNRVSVMCAGFLGLDGFGGRVEASAACALLLYWFFWSCLLLIQGLP